MTMINMSVETITYRGQSIDRGIILTQRASRKLLTRKFYPCYCKDAKDGTFISELSPHKKDVTVYVPIEMIRQVECLKVIDTTETERTEKILQVVDVQKHHVTFYVVSEEAKSRPTKKRSEFTPITTCFSQEDAWFVVNPDNFQPDICQDESESEPKSNDATTQSFFFRPFWMGHGPLYAKPTMKVPYRCEYKYEDIRIQEDMLIGEIQQEDSKFEVRIFLHGMLYYYESFFAKDRARTVIKRTMKQCAEQQHFLEMEEIYYARDL